MGISYGLRQFTLPAGFTIPGHLIIGGQSGAGKTTLVQQLISSEMLGDNAHIHVAADSRQPYLDTTPPCLSSCVETGREGVIGAIASAHAAAMARWPHSRGERRVLVLDSRDAADVITEHERSVRRLNDLFSVGRQLNISVMMTVPALNVRVLPRSFRDYAQIVTVDYPVSGDVHIVA